jgi:hypothetical protein
VAEDTGRRCSNCSAQMEFKGSSEFRTGGTSGIWKLVIGEWAELGEEKVSPKM